MNEQHMWKVFFDGGAAPNPGTGSCAYKVTNGEKTYMEAWRLEGTHTNNQAEWKACLEGIRRVLTEDPDAEYVSVVGDSELVINQLDGFYTVKRDSRKVYYDDAVQLIKSSKANFAFVYCARELNEEVDALCKIVR